VINYIDPVLAKNGFSPILDHGTRCKKYWKKTLGKICLVDSKIGGQRQVMVVKGAGEIYKIQYSASERVEEQFIGNFRVRKSFFHGYLDAL